MKIMNFTMVEVEADRTTRTANVRRIKNFPVNVEQLFLIAPTMIPTNLAGPQGQPIGKLGSNLVSGGGASVTVDGTPAQIVQQIKDAFGINIATFVGEPEPETETEVKVTDKPKSDTDNAGPIILKIGGE